MPTPPADAFLTSASKEQIAALAGLYDRFAHALDPFSPESDEAERVFMQNVADWFDSLPPPKPPLHEFRKAIIMRCKRHLAMSDRTSSI
jgi:hypothetical protein